MTPEEEMAVMVPDAISYKGVKFALPKPVADYIDGLIKDRYSAMQDMDAMHARLVASMNLPAPEPSPWVRVEDL